MTGADLALKKVLFLGARPAPPICRPLSAKAFSTYSRRGSLGRPPLVGFYGLILHSNIRAVTTTDFSMYPLLLPLHCQQCQPRTLISADECLCDKQVGARDRRDKGQSSTNIRCRHAATVLASQTIASITSNYIIDNTRVVVGH